MQTIFAWLLVGLNLAAAFPWSAWLLSKSPHQGGIWLKALLSLALSIGALTLVMFWEGIAGIRFTLWGVTLPYLALMLPGVFLWWRSVQPPSHLLIMPKAKWNWLASGMLLLISAAVLFNAAYWPFYRDDTLGIYHRYGKLMAETGALAPFGGRDDAFYQAYPMQIPLAYTYIYLVSGWVNEYLARIIPALFSLACLPTVYLLGRAVYSERAGWLAALLLAFTPTFARWASSGYVDLPMAFLYTLSALFAWRLWQGGAGVDALLAGLTLGLAAWTKNAALLGVVFLTLWLIYARARRCVRLCHISIALIACAVVAAPWYLRNWLEAGLIVPPTAWTDQAERSLATLFSFITQPQNFALTGWVILVAVGATLWSILQRGQTAPAQILLLLWTLPFFAAWWLLVSYDPRFLLLFLPLLTVMGGGLLAQLWTRLTVNQQRRARVLVIALALAMTLYIAWISVEYKTALLRDPLMGDEAKRQVVLGDS